MSVVVRQLVQLPFRTQRSLGRLYPLLGSLSTAPLRNLSAGAGSLNQEAQAVPSQSPPSPPPLPETPISVSAPVGHDKKYDQKIVQLVNDISGLTLLQVADLNELLKKTLNIPDAPMMMSGMVMGQAQAPAEEEAEVTQAKVQTAFTVKLLKFDEAKKVAIIKEIKNLLEGMNLVQAKKFVESAPTTVKADIGKEDAEKLAAALTAVGGTCEIV